MNEVRFERMVPSMIVARRNACNLAYLPVGELEWHGSHMPFGTDFFTVQYLAEESAQRLGGGVFPPVYYGDVRYQLHDSRVEWRQTYAKSMDIPTSYGGAFPLENRDGSPGGECPTRPDDGPTPAEPLPFDASGQGQSFARHIAGILLEIHLYGFRNILLLPGHGPNPPFCRKAETIYRDNVLRRSAFGPPAKTKTWFYIEAATEIEPGIKKHWIHADRWEGSITMVAAPGTVHLDQLPKDPKTIPPAFLGHPYLTESEGYNPAMKDLWPSFDYFDPRNGTSEAYGKKQLAFILDKLAEEVRTLMSTERWKEGPS